MKNIFLNNSGACYFSMNLKLNIFANHILFEYYLKYKITLNNCINVFYVNLFFTISN
jgi:hypothetical protein